jgi:hypothetical protein
MSYPKHHKDTRFSKLRNSGTSDERVYRAYDEPFSVYFHSNWRPDGWDVRSEDREWKAVVRLRDGSELVRTGAD